MKRLLLLYKNPFCILGFITILFFWQIFFKGYVPFPGDLLLSEYNPWRQSSYFGYTPGALPNKAQYFDTIREFYPWLDFTVGEIKKETCRFGILITSPDNRIWPISLPQFSTL